MAIAFVCSSARQIAFSLHPQALGTNVSYLLQITYVLGVKDKAGVWHDVLYGGGPQQVQTTIEAGSGLPSAAQVAALIKADAQNTFGGALSSVLIEGQEY